MNERKDYFNEFVIYFHEHLEKYPLPAYDAIMSEVPKSVSEYMKQIGSNGGKKSKRVLTKEQSAAMRAKIKPKIVLPAQPIQAPQSVSNDA